MCVVDMRILAQLTLVFAVASLGLAADEARESQSDDVREAVFRWQFEHHNAPAQLTNAQVYFLELGPSADDPTDEFLKRFDGHKPPVRKGSSCIVNGSAMDKKTGERGIIFRITSIVWQSDSTVEVNAGYYEGGLSVRGSLYILKREKRKWRVTGERITVES